MPLLSQRCWLNATQVNNNVNNLSYSTSVVQQGRNVPAFLVMTICRCHFVACKQRSTMRCVCVGTSQQTVLVFELKPNNSFEADTAALRFLPLPAWLFLIFVSILGETALMGCEWGRAARFCQNKRKVSWAYIPTLGWRTVGCHDWVHGSFWTDSPLCCVYPAVPEEAASYQETSWNAGGRVAIEGKKNCIFGFLSFLTFHRQDTKFRKQDSFIHCATSLAS